MVDLDPVVLARIQFGANITFHILFPSISIALGWFLLFFKMRFSSTGNPKWMEAYQFWVKVFALTFALGVVSGITMSFQFGTNWPGFMQSVGNIAGPLLAYEVLSAFFLEATFLGIMLFGMNRVSNKIHTLATFLVALGTTFSAFWILVLSSWMQRPVGFKQVDGVAFATDWLMIIFNQSVVYRLTHMVLASGLTAAFLVAGISAYRLRKGDKSPSVVTSLKSGIAIAALIIPIQIFGGDLLGLNTLKYQPAKIAAMEGVWKTEKGAPLLLFAVPDEESRSNKFSIGIPKFASFILTHDWDGEIKGLDEFKGEHPPVGKVFWSFRIMVGMGILMLLISWYAGVIFLRRKSLPHWFVTVLICMTFSGWIATVSGWYVTEIGRQPWLVQGILTTAQAASSVPSGMILTTLIAYIALYIVLIFAYVGTIFYMARRAAGLAELKGAMA